MLQDQSKKDKEEISKLFLKERKHKDEKERWKLEKDSLLNKIKQLEEQRIQHIKSDPGPDLRNQNEALKSQIKVLENNINKYKRKVEIYENQQTLKSQKKKGINIGVESPLANTGKEFSSTTKEIMTELKLKNSSPRIKTR